MEKLGGWRRVVSCLFVSCLLSGPVSADVDTAMVWLLEQQDQSGAFHSPQTSATPFQATAEVMVALSARNALPESAGLRGFDFLQAHNGQHSENLARRALVAYQLGQTGQSVLNELATRTGSNGGVRDYPNHDTAVMSTAFSLLAWSRSPELEFETTAKAVSFLIDTQHPSGGWSELPNLSSVYVTALVSMALQRYRHEFSIASMISAANEYLLSSQRDAAWSDVLDTAMTLHAVIPAVTDRSRYEPGVDALKQTGLDAGHWQNDVFLTALAIGALHLAETAPTPAGAVGAVISGVVHDKETGLPISGVILNVQGDTAQVTQTDDRGRFVVSGLAPGLYELDYKALGYASVIQTLQVQKSQQVDVGSIHLSPLPTMAMISGVVMDLTGEPIPTASVSWSGVAQGNQGVDVNGRYAISLEAGPLSLAVMAQGYRSIEIQAAPQAGQHLMFSPVLYGEEMETPEDRVAKGRIVDADNLAPLSGVMVEVLNQGMVLYTDDEGSFELNDLAEGDTILRISHPGHQSIQIRFVSLVGLNDLGVLPLHLEAPPQTSLKGMIYDGETAEPVSGARVQVGDLVVISDATGAYLLEGIAGLEFTVVIEATGYFSESYPIMLAQSGRLPLDVALERVIVHGIGIKTVTVETPLISAYESLSVRAMVENTAEQDRSVIMVAAIHDAAGSLVEEFAVNVTSQQREPDFVLAAGAEQEIEISWNAYARTPGDHTVTIRLLDMQSGRVLAERAVSFVIRPTQRFFLFSVRPDSASLVSGQSGTIPIHLGVRNASNVDAVAQFVLGVNSPDGALVHQSFHAVPVARQEIQKSLLLDHINLADAVSGRYSLKISEVTGVSVETYDEGVIDVIPNVHVDASVQISPGEIVPEVGQEIRIQLRLEGMGEAP